MFSRSLATATVASSLALMATTAHAGYVSYTLQSSFVAGATGSSAPANQVADSVNWAQFDSHLNQPSNNGSIPYGSSMTTALGEGITVANSSGTQQLSFTTFVEGQGLWDGNFVSGTTVLYNGANQTTTLTFASLLSGVGVDVQTFHTGNFTFTMTAFDSTGTAVATAIDTGTTYTNPQTGNNVSKEGTVTFVGITSTAANISYVTISSSNNANGFAIDTSLIYHNNLLGQTQQTQQTPEPGTLALLGAGLLGLGWARRRHKAA